MSAPRKRSGTRGYAHLIEINVPVARVWRALTEPALVRIWSGFEAQIDAREGGLYRIGKLSAGGREAHIDIFDPNRRLRLIYMSAPDLPSSDSAIVDDFLLDVRKGEGTTSLRLLGSGVPESSDWDQPYVKIRMGWERFMARIKVALESPPKPKKPPKVEPKDPPLPGLDY
ncbi:MAG TPA: SRPBCC domain-containing protein [Steroidobacteraceae bacterium]|nr:SRPBCC domain-containing protein [Steroidobacteraceae bacterium]